MFGKKKNKADSTEVKTKKVRDKNIKERLPKTAGRWKIIRAICWTVAILLLIKGAVEFIKGPEEVTVVNNYGTLEPAVPDNVKGFAVDFATEYFSWDSNFIEDRNSRLEPFITGIDSDAGLDQFSLKGKSTVLSASVYGSHVQPPDLTEVTVVVRRQSSMPDENDTKNPAVAADTTTKSYLVVPVTQTSDGKLVIQDYPRFSSEIPKADKQSKDTQEFRMVGDNQLNEKGKKLLSSALSALLTGNLDELKYFYLPGNAPSDSYSDTGYTFVKIDDFSLLQSNVQSDQYRIDASVIVENKFQEKFKNQWSMTVQISGNEMYVVSVQQPQQKSPEDTASSSDPSTTPISDQKKGATSNE
ncbi:conjugal transfer protein [Paenibacillus enshidis]|uniref:Conjugal transfer protein n=1 Tax=Paenibacillus enshidis TaxID=1458439 RepID=A0ABV5AXP2_9BACL